MIRNSLGMLKRYALKETLLYSVFACVSAVLVPLNLLWIDRCISFVETQEWKKFPPAFLLLAVGLMLVVYAQHRKRLADIELTETMVSRGTPGIIRKLCTMKYSYFDKADTADVIFRLSGNPMGTIANAWKKVIECISLILQLAGTALLYFRLSVGAGLSLMLVIAVQLYLGVKSQSEVNRLYSMQTIKERQMAYVGGVLRGKASIFDCKVNGSSDYVCSFQEKLGAALLKERVVLQLKSEKYYAASPLIMAGWTAWLLFRLSTGTISIGLCSVLLGSLAAIISSENTLSYQLSSITEDFLVIRSFHDFMNFEEEAGDQTAAADNNARKADSIEFKNVSFTYPGAKEPALKNVSFRINPGQSVCLVGENGSGKSTIVKLLCGLYKPDKGEILINGKELSHYRQGGNEKLFRVVFQDYGCYFLTVSENVGLGDTARMEQEVQIREALSKAGAADFTEKLPKGMDTQLGHLEEDGVQLSGGQWQRLAVARADFPLSGFLLMDEPTASMDPIAESRMYQEIVEMFHEQGLLLVSHRMASAVYADLILVLDKGELIQSGTHSSLMSEGGLYREMYQKQACWYG